jgi:hypothetical protein
MRDELLLPLAGWRRSYNSGLITSSVYKLGTYGVYRSSSAEVGKDKDKSYFFYLMSNKIDSSGGPSVPLSSIP